MPDVKDVIKGLEEVIAEAVYPDRPRRFMMPLELAEDALALLKAQEARVMTLEELRNGGIVVWYEVKGEEPCPCIVGEYDRDSRYFMGATGCGETTISEWEEYHIKWRCWTSRPTDEQREETPWN